MNKVEIEKELMDERLKKVEQSHKILDKLRQPNGLYVASTSTIYDKVWLRDIFYEIMPYLHSNCTRYEETYHSILDIFRDYEWKLDILQSQKPQHLWEYIHPRYDKVTKKEIHEEWGNAQHDAISAILFGIAEGEKAGKPIIRDKKDHEIIQKLVGYLQCCEYWRDLENGAWEEWREVHASSVGACVSALTAVKDIVFVPQWLIDKGWETLNGLFPRESNDRPVDLIQLSLIYPFKIYKGFEAEKIVNRVESVLLKKRGCIRYQGDSYFSTIEHEGRHHPLHHYYSTEAEWCFALPWLAIVKMELGDYDAAKKYIEWTESVMTEDGSLPELYYSNSDRYNENTPLGWSQAMYIQAVKMHERLTGEKV